MKKSHSNTPANFAEVLEWKSSREIDGDPVPHGITAECYHDLITIYPWDESADHWLPGIEIFLAEPENILLQSPPDIDRYHSDLEDAIDQAILICGFHLDLHTNDLHSIRQQLKDWANQIYATLHTAENLLPLEPDPPAPPPDPKKPTASLAQLAKEAITNHQTS